MQKSHPRMVNPRDIAGARRIKKNYLLVVEILKENRSSAIEFKTIQKIGRLKFLLPCASISNTHLSVTCMNQWLINE